LVPLEAQCIWNAGWWRFCLRTYNEPTQVCNYFPLPDNFMIAVTAAATAGVFLRGSIVTEVAGPVTGMCCK
jgi:hypothetical protein